MNPYEADPSKVPANDLYADVPLYGRYLPQASDFTPDPQRKHSAEYWDSILAKYNESNCLYNSVDGGRDVFALGSVIIKSSHQRSDAPKRDYAFADANEVAAIELVRDVLSMADVQVPTIHFAGKVRGRNVLVQSRIPGVTLNVAWPYLNSTQKASFKTQARRLLRLWHGIPSPFARPSYIVPDSDPVRHRNITELERSILFGDASVTEQQSNGFDQRGTVDLGLAHNDFNESNIVVANDRIIGVIDWEMAGWFGWKRTGAVHAHCRVPKRENFVRLNYSEERLADLTYWNDLFSEESRDLGGNM
ncbi:kinase-like domain-containing protein [Lineolata rhizophorae]|uniref:Kinase-like domain-containing protein n=1 Tax=Lineolata rhizophorae TaxID=578093 RepID=A0A6A6NP35_9PEZI|nr:kinase-like domain-containing protein [Lineolata rhizophorae]